MLCRKEMLDVNKRLAKGRRLSGTVNGFIWMDQRKSWSSQTTNQILYWLVGMKDISTLNPLFFLRRPPCWLTQSLLWLFATSAKPVTERNHWTSGSPLFPREPCFAAKGPKVPTPKKTTSDDWLKEQEIQHPILSLERECFKFFRMFWCDNQHERKWNPRKSTGFWWPKVGSGTKNCSRQNPKFFEVAETKTLGTHTFRLISAWEMINDQVMKQISWQKSPQR